MRQAWDVREEPDLLLTPRLRAVLQLVADGHTKREIAHELNLSPFTVKNYMERIFSRLGVRDRVEAVAVGLREGVIE